MKKVLLSSAIMGLLFLGVGCVSSGTDTSVTQSLSDFVPPEGAGDRAGIEGPWARRIMGAHSDDGLTWVKTNEVISDQADVPSLVQDDEGTLYMYYYGWTVGEKENVPAVAFSQDGGLTWTFRHITFVGYPGRGDVGDPDVLYEDGAFRLYGTTREGGRAHILYGESTDGFEFTYKGVAFEPQEGNAGVASVYQVTDGWRLFSLASLGVPTDEPVEAGLHWFASSTDGDTFTQTDSVTFQVDGIRYFSGNVIPVAGGYRMYLFTLNEGGIRSWFSVDGEEWVLEEGIRLTPDSTTGKEKTYVGDPDVIQLPDGTYFMAYATLIP